MKLNPWRLLPDKPPFVLPDDEKAVRDFNKRAPEDFKLRIDELIPEPFVGNPEAPIVLLGNNPGYRADRVQMKQESAFVARMRDNLLHKKTDYPFVFFASDVDKLHRRWWDRKFKALLHLGRDLIGRSILAVEHFPYPSRRYRAGRLSLPSGAREYSYALVKRAMERNALIVVMRGRRRWFRDVQGLETYGGLCLLDNPQTGSVSSGNCQRFQDIVRAIEANAAQTPQASQLP